MTTSAPPDMSVFVPRVSSHREHTPLDPEREGLRRSKQARLRHLQKIGPDPAIHAREKLLCGLCNEFIPPGEQFSIYLDPRMLLAFINCQGCRKEDPRRDWLYLTVKEV